MKVFDSFIFFNELDLLELKLETLNNLVDYFVISESVYTHSGKLKPLYYSQNKDRFKKFEKKIIHQIVTDTPKDYINMERYAKGIKDPFYNLVIDRVEAGDWWNHHIESYGRDTFEKESLIRPLTKALECDIILLSDLDEIVRPESLEQIIDCFNEDEIYHFQHDMFYYYLNLQKDEPWRGTIAVSFKTFLQKSFCEMRTHKTGKFVSDGGWHFTYQNGADAIIKKLESFGEQSLNLPFIKENVPNSIEYAIQIKRDLFGRPCNFTLRDINDGTFPQYLVNHQNDIYKDYLKR